MSPSTTAPTAACPRSSSPSRASTGHLAPSAPRIGAACCCGTCYRFAPDNHLFDNRLLTMTFDVTRLFKHNIVKESRVRGRGKGLGNDLMCAPITRCAPPRCR